jgi:hypothetical protein
MCFVLERFKSKFKNKVIVKLSISKLIDKTQQNSEKININRRKRNYITVTFSMNNNYIYTLKTIKCQIYLSHLLRKINFIVYFLKAINMNVIENVTPII